MLTGNNYDSFFAQPYLKNCGVVVRSNNDDTLLLDNDNISSFSLSRQNYGVPEQVPNDNISITIKDWDKLDPDIKDYLCDKTKFVKIGFVIENVETSTYIVQLIEKCKINYKGDQATLYCCSPYRLILSPVILDPTLVIPHNINETEREQHIAIKQALGMVINPIAYGTAYNPSYLGINTIGTTKNIGNYTFEMFYPIAMVSNIYLEQDENDRSNVVACGIEVLEEQTIFTKGFSHDQTFNFTLNDDYVITGYRSLWKPTEQSSTQVANILVLKTSYSIGGQIISPSQSSYYYNYEVYGYRANIKTTTDKCVINAKMVLSTDTTTLSNIQTAYRNYYSNKDYYEFEGIIDPRIEPQDNVFVEGIGTIKVETIDLSFNGGFSGRFKGRLVYAIGKLTAPDITYNSGDPEQGFELDILNQNNVPCTLVIVHSAGQIEIDMEGGEEGGFTTDDEIADLYESYVAWYNGNLQDTVYCYFVSQYGTKSDNVIILQGSD